MARGGLRVLLPMLLAVCSAGCGAPTLPLVAAGMPSPPALAPRPSVVLLRDDFRGGGLDLLPAGRQVGALAPSGWRWMQAGAYAWPDEPLVAGGRLTFSGWSAVQLRRPFGFDDAGQCSLSARIDPIEGDTKSLGWVSLLLTAQPYGSAWVGDNENVVGFLLRSSGAIQVFTDLGGPSRSCEPQWEAKAPLPADHYDVELTVRGAAGLVELVGRINEASFRAELARGSVAVLPERVFLDIGAHGEHRTPQRSSVDDLEVRGAVVEEKVLRQGR